MLTEYTPKQIERFWKRVDQSGEPQSCWSWIGSRDRHGYGRFSVQVNGKTKFLFAHRLMWFFTYGVPPDSNLKVLHECDNPCCVNPIHLRLGTQADNMHDMINKGRDACLKNISGKPRGHKRPDTAARTGEKHPNCVISDAVVAEIRRRYDAGGITQLQLSREYGMSHAWTNKIVNRQGRPDPEVTH